MKKGKVFLGAVGGLLKALWKLLLLTAYGFFKIVEVLASFLGKLTEKLLN